MRSAPVENSGKSLGLCTCGCLFSEPLLSLLAGRLLSTLGDPDQACPPQRLSRRPRPPTSAREPGLFSRLPQALCFPPATAHCPVSLLHLTGPQEHRSLPFSSLRAGCPAQHGRPANVCSLTYHTSITVPGAHAAVLELTHPGHARSRNTAGERQVTTSGCVSRGGREGATGYAEGRIFQAEGHQV